MLKPFYVSSFGGSATQWVSTVLNYHENIVCYHGTRSLPPYPSGTNDISPEKFVDGLRQSIANCSNTKIFGAVHGYYGLSLYDAIDGCDGKFAAVTRHPIKRINSLFNHHYKRQRKDWDRTKSVYMDFEDKKSDFVRLDDKKNVVFSDMTNTFHWICNGTIEK